MNYRSSLTLVQLLEEARDLTRFTAVKKHIDAALAFTTIEPGSSGRTYPRGRKLVDHIQNAAAAATSHGEDDLGDRLHDFAEYAAGNTPLNLLETRYMPGRREYDNEFMRRLLEVGVRRSIEFLGAFAAGRPDATADDARRWLRDAAEAMDRWTVGESKFGGVQLSWQDLDLLKWLRRVELIVENSIGDMSISPEVAETIARMPGSELVAREAQRLRRSAALDQLRAVVDDPTSNEKAIHAELKQQTWIFGGRYVKELARRRLTRFDEIDIPLQRGDGSLHIVELKRANIPHLVERPRSHCSVGIEIHRGVVQAANYLRSLDEERDDILAKYGIECRRASATVLVGHPKFVKRPFSSSEVAAAMRTYNSALSRIEVLTYQELIDAADRTLGLDEAG